jgi:hypothetical protein
VRAHEAEPVSHLQQAALKRAHELSDVSGCPTEPAGHHVTFSPGPPEESQEDRRSHLAEGLSRYDIVELLQLLENRVYSALLALTVLQHGQHVFGV